MGRATDIGFILARAECDRLQKAQLKKQLAMEPIEIATRIGEMRTSSIEFLCEIRKADGTVAAIGRIVAVLFDWERQTKKPIGDDLRKKVAALQA
jgi:acyl-CoA thioesterase FadM